MAHGDGQSRSLIDDVYDAAMGMRAWSDVLAGISSAISAETSIAELFPGNRRQPFTTARRLTADEIRDYQARIMPRDEMLKLSFRYPAGALLQSQRLMDTEAMERTEIYNEIYRKIGLYFFASSHVVRDEDSWVFFTAQRPKHDGPLGGHDFGLFGEIVPHVARAIRIQRQLDAKRLLASGAMRCSDAAGLAVVLVDGAGAVLDLNQTAARLLEAEEGPLRIVQGGVEAMVDGVSRRLEHAAADRKRCTSPTLMRLGDTHVGAYIPLSPERREALQLLEGPAAALVVNCAGGGDRSLEGRLSEIYGLTRAEARVAASVACGKSITAAATHLGLSRETVRSQLKRVFSKTGTARQAELALLVSRMPNPSLWGGPLPS